jgi:uncharacterized protein YjiS (DUF1127 family)
MRSRKAKMSTIEAIAAGFFGRYPSGAGGFSVARTLWGRFLRHRQLQRTRLHLLELTDDQLRDIGITREAADREAARSIMAHYMHNAR